MGHSPWGREELDMTERISSARSPRVGRAGVGPAASSSVLSSWILSQAGLAVSPDSQVPF